MAHTKSHGQILALDFRLKMLKYLKVFSGGVREIDKYIDRGGTGRNTE
jgi:hypothetical protein